MTTAVLFALGVNIGYLLTLGARLNHIHHHVKDSEELLDWLVIREGGDPERIKHSVHYDTEIGGPNAGY